MSQLLHYIDFLDGNGFVLVKPPVEWKDLEIELTFETDSQRLSTTDFSWYGDTAEKINTARAAGLSGGAGVFEALPYKVVLMCENVAYDIVVAGLNLSSKNGQYSCDAVKVPIREKGKIDFLTARADSFRFELLASITGPGAITSSDYIDINYMVGKYPQGLEIMMTSVTLFLMIKEAYETTKRIGDAIAAVVGGATGFLESILQIALLVIYLIILVVAIYNMIQKLISLIFPFVYYHRAMFARTLWQKGCDYLGLAFSSSILSSSSPYFNEYIMPPKNAEGKKIGNPSTETGFYKGTFGDFIRGQIEQYNGEIKIIGNTLFFERKGSFSNLSTYVIPEVDFEFKGDNSDEVSANYLIEYLYDEVDLNDFNAPAGRIIQANVEPVVVFDKQNITLDGLQTRSIPYTLPNVKTTQSELEVEMILVFNAFAFLVNSIASLFSSSSTPIPYIPFGSNINVLQLDTHFTNHHKCGIYTGNGHTSSSSSTILGARELFDNFHYTEIVKPLYSNANGNQWETYEGYQVPMCCDTYLQIKDNNYGTYKGDTAHLLSVKWRPYDQTATLNFEANRKYTDNLKVNLLEFGQPTIIL